MTYFLPGEKIRARQRFMARECGKNDRQYCGDARGPSLRASFRLSDLVLLAAESYDEPRCDSRRLYEDLSLQEHDMRVFQFTFVNNSVSVNVAVCFLCGWTFYAQFCLKAWHWCQKDDLCQDRDCEYLHASAHTTDNRRLVRAALAAKHDAWMPDQKWETTATQYQTQDVRILDKTISTATWLKPGALGHESVVRIPHDRETRVRLPSSLSSTHWTQVEHGFACDVPDFEVQRYKRVRCYFDKRGGCRRGEACTFLHQDDGVSANTCRQWLFKFCDGRECDLQHWFG